MSSETNLAMVRRAVAEIWNGLNLELADYLFDPSYVNHGGIIPDVVVGPESMKFAVVLQHTAFPQLHIRERGVAAEGEVVELRWAARRFTQTYGNRGRAPVFVAQGTTLIRCDEDQIAESWTTWNSSGLGALASPDDSGVKPPPPIGPVGPGKRRTSRHDA